MSLSVQHRLDRVRVFEDVCAKAPGAEHTDPFYDWCGAASTCIGLTMDALRANWTPRELSTITVGVTSRDGKYGVKEVHAVKKHMKPHEAEDSAWVRAAYMLHELKPFVKQHFGLNIRATSIRSYKGLSTAGENRGAHMIYVTFLTSPKIIGARVTERFHYLSGQCEVPHSAMVASMARSANAAKAWETMRNKNTL